MSIFVILIIAVSLSMDAFSLALIYGTLSLSNKTEYLVSISVGIFHFFMPIFGVVFGNFLLKAIFFNPDIITGIIFIGLGIEMILSVKKKEKVKELNSLLSILLFSFAVSIDSFLIGVNFGINHVSIILSSTLFMLVSATFTYAGLKLGKKINNIMGKLSTIIGSIILIILGIFYLK